VSGEFPVSLRSKLDKWLYPRVGDRWDILRFREEALKLIKPGMTVLDLGAGRGALEELRFQGYGAQIWGADIDPVVMINPYLDRAFVTTVKALDGVPDHSVDLVLSCSVLEHVAEPEALLSELHRVLKPGGVFLAKTPNKFHYMPLVASLTPIWFHKLYNRWRGRDEVDTFPTLYRFNSRRATYRLAATTGFTVEQLWTLESRPEYLRLTPPTYIAGWLYERMVNSLGMTDLRCVLFMQLQAKDGFQL
jgi:SAM-dependent methyltransferase